MNQLRHLVIPLLASLLSSTLLAQAPDTLWTRTYGGLEGDMLQSIQRTADGDFVMAGGLASMGSTGEFWLVKTNAQGDTLWTKTYGGASWENCYSMQMTSDGGFVLVGGTESYGAGIRDIYIVRTDDQGDTLWTNTYGSSESEVGNAVLQTSDDGFLIVADVGPEDTEDIWLVRTDSFGDTLWTKRYGETGKQVAASLIPTVDGGYMIVGTRSFGDGTAGIWLLKTDAVGDTTWSKTIDVGSDGEGTTVVQTADSGYAIFGIIFGTLDSPAPGGDDRDWLLIKTDSLGNLQWSQTYGGDLMDQSFDMLLTDDDGFLLTGALSVSGNFWDLWLVRANSLGNTVWTTTVGATGEDVCTGLLELADGEYAVSGLTDSWGAGNYDGWLVRLGVVDITPPATPTGFAAIAGDSEVNLQWDAYQGMDYNEYYVYMGYTGVSWAAVDTTSQSQSTVTGLTNGTPYYFYITAVDGAGNKSAPTDTLTATPQTGLFVADSLALVALYNSTGGTSWTRQNGWLTTTSLTDWDGVTVVSGRVTKLNLYALTGQTGLTGDIPISIGDLTGLTSLRLWNNAITSVPEEIGNLVNLNELALSNNQISTLPESIGNLTQLKDLYLSKNLLANLPSGIAELENLKYLGLSTNQLTSLPPAVTGLSNLENLSLDENAITEIPAAIGSLDSLRGLGLGDNLITAIPADIANLANLNALGLSGNLLTSIPDVIGSLSNLTELLLSDNQLTTVPDALGNLTNLTTLYLNGNQLTSVPATLGNLTNLNTLYLNGNQLTSFTTDLSGMDSLFYLELGSNQFTSIPADLFNLPNLKGLYLNNNRLTGAIPTGIGNLTNLHTLWLNTNELTGPIPDAISKLVSLRYLNLYNNQLSGSIPDTIGNLLELEQLLLGNNQLSGTIPAALGKDTSLTTLFLDGNDLIGAVPEEITNLLHLYYLMLSNNQLEDLPDLSAMPALVELHLGNNRFTFEDIEPNVNLAAASGPLEYYYYSPQDSVGVERVITIAENGDVDLVVPMGGTATTTYQWMRNGVDIVGATDTTYSITGATHDDGGAYNLHASNTLVPNLELISRTQFVAAPNNVPIVAADSLLSLPSGTAFGFDVVAMSSDPDGDELKVANHKSTANGSTYLYSDESHTSVLYQSRKGYTGQDTVWYTIDDGFLGKATGRVILTITDQNYEPFLSVSRTIGGDKDDYVYSMAEVEDGGFVMVGYTESKGSGGKDGWLVKVNAAGAVAWEKTFVGAEEDIFYSIKALAAGGFIIAGETESAGAGDADAWLIKVDASGIKTWEQTYGGSDFENAISVLAVDGGYIFGGQTDTYGAGDSDAWLVKTNTTGDTTWTKTFGGAKFDHFTSVQATSDGGYVAVGSTDLSEVEYWEYHDIWLVKIDVDGGQTWVRTFGGTGDERAYSVEQTTDGGYIIAGSTEPYQTSDSDVWIIKTDASGQTVWTTTYEDNGNDAAHSVHQTPGGGYLATGYIYNGHSGYDIWVAWLNSQGTIDRQYRNLGGYGTDWGMSALMVEDGDVVVAANTTAFGSGGYDLWFMKLDMGEINSVDDATVSVPKSFALHQNYPNPFNPSTTVRYDLPEAAEVTLLVYDLLGREVVRLVDGRLEAGYHRVVWNGRDHRGREVPTGLYIVRMFTPEYTRSIKLVLLK